MSAITETIDFDRDPDQEEILRELEVALAAPTDFDDVAEALELLEELPQGIERRLDAALHRWVREAQKRARIALAEWGELDALYRLGQEAEWIDGHASLWPLPPSTVAGNHTPDALLAVRIFRDELAEIEKRLCGVCALSGSAVLADRELDGGPEEIDGPALSCAGCYEQAGDGGDFEALEPVDVDWLHLVVIDDGSCPWVATVEDLRGHLKRSGWQEGGDGIRGVRWTEPEIACGHEDPQDHDQGCMPYARLCDHVDIALGLSPGEYPEDVDEVDELPHFTHRPDLGAGVWVWS